MGNSSSKNNIWKGLSNIMIIIIVIIICGSLFSTCAGMIDVVVPK